MDRAQRLISGTDGVDAVVIMNGTEPFLDSVFWYLTEQTSGTFEQSVAVVSENGTLDVITGTLEETCARNGKGNVHVYETKAERDGLLSDILKGTKSIGINAHSVSYASAEYLKRTFGAKMVDVSKAIQRTISIKDAKEVKTIRKACDIASRTAMRIPDVLDKDTTERDMAAFIDRSMREDGADGNSFETISAFGANSAEPHHRPSDRRPTAGDAALFDSGCRYERYCSDLTRTVFFKEPANILKRAYAVVSEAKAAGMDAIRDGAAVKEADDAARRIIDKTEFRGSFIHSFGHGVGMDVHEGISVSGRSDQIFSENMVVTAEPGIYIPGIGGIRIEDTVLVKKNGCEPLTKFDQSMVIL